jgi:hypothetical protein
MAKVLSNGLISGRVGNLVYYVKDGKQFVKMYTEPKDAKTPKQMFNRAKMRDCSKFFKQFNKVISIGYQSYGSALKLFNQVVKYHMANAMEETTAEGNTEYAFRVVPEKVILSEGLIQEPEIINCLRTKQEIELTWHSHIGKVPNRHTDSLALVAYSEGKPVHAEFHAGLRRQGSIVATLPNGYTDPVHLWTFYWNGEKQSKPGKEKVSGSVYLGVF